MLLQGLNKLLSLKLQFVTLSSNTFEILISNCPLHEDLVLKDINNSYLLRIDSPKLRSFVFCGDIQLIYLVNLPLLSNVLYEPAELVLEENSAK